MFDPGCNLINISTERSSLLRICNIASISYSKNGIAINKAVLFFGFTCVLNNFEYLIEGPTLMFGPVPLSSFKKYGPLTRIQSGISRKL